MRIGKIGLAVLLLAALYAAADWRDVMHVLCGLDARYLAAALLLFVPQTLVSAWRWQLMVRAIVDLPLVESTRHTLAASAMNLVLPSKLGDISKAVMLPGIARADQGRAARAAVVEKLMDVAALAVLWFVATPGVARLAVLPALAAFSVLAWQASPIGHSRPPVASGWIALLTLMLWGLHLVQIDCFLKAAGVFVPWTTCVSRVPAAIFTGLLPVSFCGIGTRDAMLVWLFSDVAPASTMAAVGLLTALRYVVPGAAGIPLVPGLLRPGLRGPSQGTDGVTLAAACSGSAWIAGSLATARSASSSSR